MDMLIHDDISVKSATVAILYQCVSNSFNTNSCNYKRYYPLIQDFNNCSIYRIFTS